MPLRCVVRRSLELDTDSGVEDHELLQLLRNERPLSPEGRAREGEDSLILVGSPRAGPEKSREHEGQYESCLAFKLQSLELSASVLLILNRDSISNPR